MAAANLKTKLHLKPNRNPKSEYRRSIQAPSVYTNHLNTGLIQYSIGWFGNSLAFGRPFKKWTFSMEFKWSDRLITWLLLFIIRTLSPVLEWYNHKLCTIWKPNFQVRKESDGELVCHLLPLMQTRVWILQRFSWIGRFRVLICGKHGLIIRPHITDRKNNHICLKIRGQIGGENLSRGQLKYLGNGHNRSSCCPSHRKTLFIKVFDWKRRQTIRYMWLCF